MNGEVGVLYKGLLALYQFRPVSGEWFYAELVSYKGAAEQAPARLVIFKKEGRHCTGNIADLELMDDLYLALTQQGPASST